MSWPILVPCKIFSSIRKAVPVTLFSSCKSSSTFCRKGTQKIHLCFLATGRKEGGRFQEWTNLPQRTWLAIVINNYHSHFGLCRNLFQSDFFIRLISGWKTGSGGNFISSFGVLVTCFRVRIGKVRKSANILLLNQTDIIPTTTKISTPNQPNEETWSKHPKKQENMSSISGFFSVTLGHVDESKELSWIPERWMRVFAIKSS